jgi:hypothetical protein
MAIPKVRTDFNSNSLGNHWALEDLSRQGIQLCEGMRCLFYDLDCEGGEQGFLHSDGAVWWDEKSEVFRIDMSTVNLQFTPGNDLSVIRVTLEHL